MIKEIQTQTHHSAKNVSVIPIKMLFQEAKKFFFSHNLTVYVRTAVWNVCMWTLYIRSCIYNVNYYVQAIFVVCMFCFPSESLLVFS